ncbi:uncharacterized protein LOC109712938 [Ananas comosus]|uniref:Uncharacterized protein LOC109712938 n=1 Tax=Ananas comosus TaxID=4615 RepID=A0A6P5FFX4_ANACO|nr:uncharacterized protein LOC109712938 [Ananas comosus]
MAWRGSISRSLLSTAPSTAARLRPPPLAAAPRPPRRRLPFAPTRPVGALGCAQSLLPIHSVVALPRLTSHLSVTARACCELSQGT